MAPTVWFGTYGAFGAQILYPPLRTKRVAPTRPCFIEVTSSRSHSFSTGSSSLGSFRLRKTVSSVVHQSPGSQRRSSETTRREHPLKDDIASFLPAPMRAAPWSQEQPKPHRDLPKCDVRVPSDVRGSTGSACLGEVLNCKSHGSKLPGTQSEKLLQ